MDELKTKDINIYNFFLQNIDRHYIVNELFPTIGVYLKNENKHKVLNLGIAYFNKYDKNFFKNDNLYFCGLDKDPKPLFNSWNKMYQANMIKPLNIGETFDVIIDYGVIGWPGINKTLEETDIHNYFKNVKNLLKDDGLYFLKIDYKNKTDAIKNSLVEKVLFQYLKTASFSYLKPKILKQNLDGKSIEYHTMILQK